MKKCLLVILIIAFIDCTLAQTNNAIDKSGKTVQVIKKLMKEIDEAHLHSDTLAFDRIWARDYILIDWRGTIKNREQSMAEWKAAEHQYESYQSVEVSVRVYRNTAIVNALVIRKSKTDPENFGRFRHTRVFVKQKDQWKLVTTQVTRIIQE